MRVYVVVYELESARGQLVFHSAFDTETFEADPEPAHAAVAALRKQPEIHAAGVAVVSIPDTIVIPYLAPDSHRDTFVARVDTVL